MFIRKEHTFGPDISRVITQFHHPGSEERIKNIINRVLSLSENKRKGILHNTLSEFAHRHRNLPDILMGHFEKVGDYIPGEAELSKFTKLLIGTYFTMEFSIEGVALFNPSIVSHPDQDDVAEGSERVILSFRATGEGHISSIEFRTGVMDQYNNLKMDQEPRYAVTPEEKDEHTLVFPNNSPVSEHVLYPTLPAAKQGMEDARFVEFNDENGQCTYYGTFTAYDGNRISPMLIKTADFREFNFIPLKGENIHNKGMALFPRKIDGQYAMVSRIDGENLYLMYSDSINTWDEIQLLREPTFPWEYFQLGNCGSPIEIDEGWLLITHGVGPMRRYCIGIDLLDKNDPSRILAQIPEPLIVPGLHEREGYVPNVVYSCGGMVRQNELILPYAIADAFCAVGTISVPELLELLEWA